MMGIFTVTLLLGFCVAGIWAQGGRQGLQGSTNVCVYGKDFNAGDGSAQLRPMADTAWTPALQPRSEKFLLASNPDPTDPCRFKLEITMKEVNGVPVLANAIFRFGVSELDNPNRFPRNVKFGGNGVFGKLRGDGIDSWIPVPFPFSYDDGVTNLEMEFLGDGFVMHSGMCNWAWKYFLGQEEYLRFFEDQGLDQGFDGACYEPTP